jgi:hypothetical protein
LWDLKLGLDFLSVLKRFSRFLCVPRLEQGHPQFVLTKSHVGLQCHHLAEFSTR